MNTDMWR